MFDFARNFVVTLGLLACLGGQALAQDSLLAIPRRFEAPPNVLLKLAKDRKVREGVSVHIVFDDSKYEYDAEGRGTYTWRRVYQILGEESVSDWSAVSMSWSPWYQERPEIQARVITADGVEHKLDLKTITESAQNESQDVYSDARRLSAPLPAVAVGAVVEEEIVVKDKVPFYPKGSSMRFHLDPLLPIGRSRLEVSAPASIPLNLKTVMIPEGGVKKLSNASIHRWEINFGPIEKENEVLPMLPSDRPRRAAVDFSTGQSWRELASHYSEQVDAQIQGADLRALLAKAPNNGSRRETIAALIAAVHAEVRYTGLELGAAALVPAKSAEVLKRHYGDCKDKAALLVALLRAKGIPAYVALLLTGPGRDVEPELPGMGLFDHAIVYVPKGADYPEYWIDATEEYAVLGVLAPRDRGRLAMIARAETTGLTATPELKSIENYTKEVREFFLTDFGPSRVLETTLPNDQAASALRAHYAASEQRKLEKDLEGYVKNTYLAEALTKYEHSKPSDLKKPFELRLESAKAGRGTTEEKIATVAIRLENLLSPLPDFFATEPDKEEKKDRKEDFYNSEPYTLEWEYKITPPAGFAVREMPKASEESVGVATLIQSYEALPNGAVAARIRFDSGKSRFTAAEGYAMRDAVLAFKKKEPIFINFDHRGEALLSKGQVREALGEFRAEAIKQPKSGLPRMRIAMALLQAGLGEAARNEAVEATKLDPKSSLVWQKLGYIRQFDLVGRFRRPGFDWEGAVAAYAKAKELDAENWNARADYAIVLEHNSLGDRYRSGARLDDAIAEYRAIGREKLNEFSMASNLAFALFHAKRYEELKKELGEMPQNVNRHALRIVLAGLDGGATAALKEAGNINNEADRRQALMTAATLTALRREYAVAADLAAASSRGSSNAPAVMNLANMFRAAKRIDWEADLTKEPSAPVRRLMGLQFGEEEPSVDRFWPLMASIVQRNRENSEKQSSANFFATRKTLKAQAAAANLTVSNMGDVIMTVVQQFVEGDDAKGWRVRWKTGGGNGAASMDTYFVVKEKNEYRILGTNEGLADLGREALRRAKQGDLEGARLLLDWARETQSRSGGDDPLASVAFVNLWEKGQQGDLNAVLAAAATIALADEESADVLKKLRADAREAATQKHLDHALFQSAIARRKREEIATYGKALLAVYPQSAMALQVSISALGNLKRYAEAEALLAERLRKNANDEEALRAGINLALIKASHAEMLANGKKLIEIGEADVNDYNNLAWGVFAEKGAVDEALQFALKGASTQKLHFGLLHTLAAIYAGAGKMSEAREYLVQAMETAKLEQPNSECNFVLGEIAEGLGMKDAALALYAKLKLEAGDDDSAYGSRALAAKRVAALTGTSVEKK